MELADIRTATLSCQSYVATIGLVICLTSATAQHTGRAHNQSDQTVLLTGGVSLADTSHQIERKSTPTSSDKLRRLEQATDQRRDHEDMATKISLLPTRTASRGAGRPREPQTLAQFEESFNEVRKRMPEDAGLYLAIKNQNKTRDAEQTALYARELDRDFLSLFDELWKIKNSSVTALVRLDYFNNQTVQHDDYNQQSTNQQGGAQNGTRNTTDTKNLEQNRNTLLGHRSKSNLKRDALAQAASRLNGWFSAARQRFQLALDDLGDKLAHKLNLLYAGLNKGAARQGQHQGAPSNQTNRRTNIFENSDKPERLGPGEETDLEPNNTKILAKRSVSGIEQFHVRSLSCNILTDEETAKCRSNEQLISGTLNNSFPGTVKAIEDNCRLITVLFTNCWPDQLQLLRGSLTSWNESLLAHTDFPLPAGFLDQRAAPDSSVSCGLVPQMPQFLRDRVNWMWLNLCIDKKFRQDYVTNLGCLSTWNQEKAQQVCNHEYRRMQNYLASQAETGNALGASFEWARGNNNQRTRLSSATTDESVASIRAGEKTNPGEEATELTVTAGSPTSVGSAGGGVGGGGNAKVTLSESELTDREVSSKMLCCMFDQFLRCVHRQAVRDCGRPGAQFVVNFMSRIGTDDMKFLCNSETKTVSRSSKSSGRRGGSHDSRSPFIDGHYCTDPRIQNGLFNNQLDRFGSSGSAGSGSPGGGSAGGGGGGGSGASGGGSSSFSSKSSMNRNKLGDKTNINHDPTFFGSESVAQSSAAVSHSPDSIHVLLVVIILIVYHSLALDIHRSE